MKCLRPDCDREVPPRKESGRGSRGVKKWCSRTCKDVEGARRYKQRHPDRRKAAEAKWRRANPDYHKQWYRGGGAQVMRRRYAEAGYLRMLNRRIDKALSSALLPPELADLL